MKQRPGEKIKLKSVDELLGVSNEESSLDIPMEQIVPFKDHPFKVVDDAKMQELVESIRENGVLTPAIVRPAEAGGYEMISGHRRMHAAKLAGLTAIPAIIRDMDDDTATIVMVEANAQREEVLPSEKAFAYRMKLDAIKHQGKATRTSSQVGRKLEAAAVVAEEAGESRNQIHRFVRLTELIPEFLDMVDAGKIALMTAVDISYLEHPIQKILYKFMQENGVMKSYQVRAVRQYVDENGSITELKIKKLFEDSLIGRYNRKVVLTDKKLKEYFSSNYSPADMEKVICRLLEQWKAEKDKKKEEAK
ncbi:ParB/RepB/Spo0J family partition protein [Oribacterium sp. FC2011]|uniref:ParB/RepB/Spo0J family partition protein n=1 Tax=Oribacterium sp. FC2011 TaxID=1408311 RepID=UPI0004E1D591|nr:ParB/RepB/Spo0J family partition protein [Oribacterium sp. FC2011]